MSRSAVDATRFTATSPHAYSKPSPIRSAANAINASRLRQTPGRPPNPNAPIPPSPNNKAPQAPTETPQQKVARIRAARNAERANQLTAWEKVVIRGRVWADRAHRFTAISLIGLTVIAGGITAFALTDMILHNRRKRTAFYNEQHTLYAQRLLGAIETEKAGLPLTEDQVLVMNREKAKIQAEELAKQSGIWNTVKGGIGEVFVGGLKKDMDDTRVGDDVGFEAGKVPTEAEILEKIGVDPVEVLEASEGKRKMDGQGQGQAQTRSQTDGGLLAKVDEKRREGERAVEARGAAGGPLDKEAERTAERVKGSGWFNWGTGK